MCFTSCDEIGSYIDAAKGAIPSFSTSLPFVLSGYYVESVGNNSLSTLSLFKDGTYKYTATNGEVLLSPSGSYTYVYGAFDLTKVSGTFTFSLDGGKSVTYDFYWKADADVGPESLTLGDKVTFSYEGGAK